MNAPVPGRVMQSVGQNEPLGGALKCLEAKSPPRCRGYKKSDDLSYGLLLVLHRSSHPGATHSFDSGEDVTAFCHGDLHF
jgi:hypothetical protein